MRKGSSPTHAHMDSINCNLVDLKQNMKLGGGVCRNPTEVGEGRSGIAIVIFHCKHVWNSQRIILM